MYLPIDSSAELQQSPPWTSSKNIARRCGAIDQRQSQADAQRRSSGDDTLRPIAAS
jgi:hypothetical protein